MKPTPSASDIESMAMRTGQDRETISRVLWSKWRREALFDLKEELKKQEPGSRLAHIRITAQLHELVCILYSSEL